VSIIFWKLSVSALNASSRFSASTR
jgi:hypothetical protein